MIGAVVLAAGLSRRMGRPKMALPWGETTVIGRVVRVLLAAEVEDIVVVTGGNRKEVEASLDGLPVRTAFNDEFANGEMLLTLKRGLITLRDEVEAALVVLGDQPQIKLVVVQAVIAAYEDCNHPFVVPSYQMRRGHPWLVARTLWNDLLELHSPATMRTFLDQNAININYVNVNSPSILQDLDTPEDYQRFNPRNFE
jgi:molybdenum cofactor cytidylyltransferase